MVSFGGEYIQIDVGKDTVYGITKNNKLHKMNMNYDSIRTHFTLSTEVETIIASSTTSTSTATISCEMSWVSVSPSGSVWSIDTSGNLGHFTGSNNSNLPAGE